MIQIPEEIKNNTEGEVEETYIMIKPGFADSQEVVDLIKQVIVELGLEIEEEGYVKYTREDAQKHYAEHFRGSYENAKGFYKELEDYITSGKAFGMKVKGKNAIAKFRAVTGSTIKIDKETGKEILPAEGTIRYEIPNLLGLKHDMTANVVHASDKPESAKVELSIFNRLRGQGSVEKE